jgi:hypothetical protein
LFFIIILKSNVLKGWDLVVGEKEAKEEKGRSVEKWRGREEMKQSETIKGEFYLSGERAVHKTWESCGARILSTLLNANDRSYDVVHSYTHKK